MAGKKKNDKKKEDLPNPDNFYEILESKWIGPEPFSMGRPVSKEINKTTAKLQEVARKYRSFMKEIQDAFIEHNQEWIIFQPTVYVARTKDKKNDQEYFTAKTVWPLKNGKTKEIKIYLGKAEEFDNDTMNSRAKEYAKKKMSETLRRRKDLEEI